MPPHYLEAEESQSGFPCPRREWPSPDGATVMQLCQLGARGDQAGHLFRELFDAYFGHEAPAVRRRVLRMIFRAYGDEAVRAAMWPKQD